MDYEAVWLASEDDLEKLGLVESGHVIALKVLCMPKSLDTQQQQIDLATSIRQTGSERASSSKSNKQRQLSMTKTVELGLKVFDSKLKRFVRKVSEKGGGTRKVDLDSHASDMDILEVCRNLYFPDGKSMLGKANDFILTLHTFDGQDLDKPFVLTDYVSKHRLTKTRIYLYAKKKSALVLLNEVASGELSDSDDDFTSVYPQRNDTRSNNNDFTSLQTNDTPNDDDDFASPDVFSPHANGTSSNTLRRENESSSLLQSSEERALLRNEIDAAYEASANVDSQRERQDRVSNEETDRKEQVRMTRQQMVEEEPDLASPHHVVFVRHPTLGMLKRVFPEESTIASVYYWVGSLSTDPEHFSLCERPNLPILNQLTPVHEITSVLMVEIDSDKCGTSNLILSSSIEKKRQEAHEKLQLNEILPVIKRSNIISDLLEQYALTPTLTEMQPAFAFSDENAVGDGVVKDVFSCFFERFLEVNFDGTDAQVPSSNIDEDDCKTFGKILTHAYVAFGIFPIQISKASFMHYLTGNVAEEDLIASFVAFFHQKEGRILEKALDGSIDADAVMDILSDFRISALPNSANIRGLIIRAANTALLRNPCFPFQEIIKGMGTFWAGVKNDDLRIIYERAEPTAERFLSSCSIEQNNEQEAKCAVWFSRYIRCCSIGKIRCLLRFCTGSINILPSTKIKVDWNNMVGVSMRPTSATCFQFLHLPKNHSSFQRFMENIDLYICSDHWQMND